MCPRLHGLADAEDEVLLEVEPMPEIFGDLGEVNFLDCGVWCDLQTL